MQYNMCSGCVDLPILALTLTNTRLYTCFHNCYYYCFLLLLLLSLFIIKLLEGRYLDIEIDIEEIGPVGLAVARATGLRGQGSR